MSKHDLGPFNPEDAGDIAGEMFRRGVMQLAIDAQKLAIYRDLDAAMQLEVFIAGALTGIVGVCFASVHQDSRDAIMEHIVKCLPAARMQVDGIK